MSLSFEMYAVILAVFLIVYAAPGVYVAYSMYKDADAFTYVLLLIGGFIAMPVYVVSYLS